MQYIDQNFWLPGDILAKADRMSMAHSLELRVPFLDKEVYDVAKTIPTELLVTKQTTKALLREAFADLVPDHVLHRPKLGFPVPLRDWLRGSRGEQCLERIYRAGVGDYVNLTYAKQLVEEHQASLADHSRKIWVLYVFAVWYEQNIGVRQSDVSVEQFV
ncbi:asparagine synthase C-terminal domain-containing protein [Geomicrobium sp. JCM 19037]|uniref:asparagine synthase-related protein n=1 Tax=Geomicrobium sp. JCM 19037 TaxID=1460634 RepID=UPI001EE63CB1|nr:asparagine synthase C-terminal domain-containing protein [Geomicrobium sp. JCM 19037]